MNFVHFLKIISVIFHLKLAVGSVTFTMRRDPMRRTVGDNVTINCKWTQEIINISWSHNGVLLEKNSSVSWKIDKNMASLTIKNIQLNQDGKIDCNVTNGNASDYGSMHLDVVRKPKGKPTLTSNVAMVKVLDTINFNCNISEVDIGSMKLEEMTYRLIQQTRKSEDRNVTDFKTASFQYTPETVGKQKFWCRTSNALNKRSDLSDPLFITVEAPMKCEHRQIEKKKRSYSCILSGSNPKTFNNTLRIKWQSSTIGNLHTISRILDLNINGSYSYSQRSAIKSKLSFKKNFEKQLTCEQLLSPNNITCTGCGVVAGQENCVTSQPLSLRLPFPPKSDYPKRGVIFRNESIGSDVEMDVDKMIHVCAYPEITEYIWSGPAVDRNHSGVSSSRTLKIRNISEHDFGMYYCYISNGEGGLNLTIRLAAPEPSQPEQVNVTFTTSSAVSLTWIASRGLGFSPPDYRLTLRVLKSMMPAIRINATDANCSMNVCSVNITSLVPNSQYTVKIKAVDSNRKERRRNSDWSETLKFSTKDRINVSLTGVEVNDENNLVVSWDVNTKRRTARSTAGIFDDKKLQIQYRSSKDVEFQTYEKLMDLDAREAVIVGDFNASEKYLVKLVLFENGIVSYETSSLRAPPKDSYGMISGFIVSLLIAAFIVIVFIIVRQRRKRTFNLRKQETRDASNMYHLVPMKDARELSTVPEEDSPGGFSSANIEDPPVYSKVNFSLKRPKSNHATAAPPLPAKEKNKNIEKSMDNLPDLHIENASDKNDDGRCMEEQVYRVFSDVDLDVNVLDENILNSLVPLDGAQEEPIYSEPTSAAPIYSTPRPAAPIYSTPRPVEPIYSNYGTAKEPIETTRTINPQGLIYQEVEFGPKTVNSSIIHRRDSDTVYADIDYNQTPH